nr:MAG: hypothetical protein [Microvirus sp.]
MAYNPIFVNPFDYVPPEGEENSGDEIVEKAGYIPAKDQIETMINAGQRLADARAYEFGPDDDVPDDYYDPTRNPGFDLSDATIMANQADQRLEDAKAAAKAKKNDPTSGVVDVPPTVPVVPELNPKS